MLNNVQIPKGLSDFDFLMHEKKNYWLNQNLGGWNYK